jgi:hypothetical protein
MSPIPGEPLDPKPHELTTQDGRTFKLKVPGLPDPVRPTGTSERGEVEPPREDPRTVLDPNFLAPGSG